ncbi:GGDEF domain-containing protein [Neptunomonas antarctica]|uniref:diguanylate cyclase n=1 Tax=Neptunomonas antarctica TaxID=619304 RepID=A0A1N7IY79_9GAMM|nr:GGDEF domain-containing protein [Neptunomonas antarctica]SIS42019.1 diguanylate cyclase (GGDEF) domain-containing protein [Neptunomonas antarctica]
MSDYNETLSQVNDQRKKNIKKQQKNLYTSLISSTLNDVLFSRSHSNDFTQTRYKYIRIRLQLMCLFFAISVPLFAFFDYTALPVVQADFLLKARMSLSISLFILVYIIHRHVSLLATRVTFLLAFLLPSLFYLISMESFNTDALTTPLTFKMMPYLIISMLGLFPLTICSGLLMIIIVFLPAALFELDTLNQNYYPLLNKTWLFILFSGISLWLQAGQLSMLMKLYRESTIDPLTGLINRRVLLRQARIAQKNATQYSQPFSVMMFDLDRFKRINDNYGHAIGDKVLVSISGIMKEELRSADTIARYGGEEFVVILPDVCLAHAIVIAERIANTIRRQEVSLEDNNAAAEIIHVTSSIGVTQYMKGEDIEQTLKRVDNLLYHAKESGRDKVIYTLEEHQTEDSTLIPQHQNADMAL